MVQFSGSSIAGIVISVLILFVLIFNVIYIGGVRNALKEGGANIKLSKGAADFIFWVDIALIVLVVMYLIYVLFIIFTTTEERTGFKQRVTGSQAGLGATLRPNIYYPKQS